MRRSVLLLVLVIVAAGTGASASSAPKPTFAGKWSGTYTFSLHNYPCHGFFCLPGTPGYCGPGLPNPCPDGQGPDGVCPDIQLSGRASMTIAQTGSRITGTITLTDGSFLPGPSCTRRKRVTTRAKVTAKVAGRVASAELEWEMDGKLTLAGETLRGSFSGQTEGLVQRLDLNLSR